MKDLMFVRSAARWEEGKEWNGEYGYEGEWCKWGKDWRNNMGNNVSDGRSGLGKNAKKNLALAFF